MEYIWQISFPLFSFLFEMNCRLAASNVWHSFSFSLLGLNPNTNLNFTSSALFVNILAVAAKCFPKAHKTQNPKGKYCLAAIKFAFYHLWAASRVQSPRSGRAHFAPHSSHILKGNGELGADVGGMSLPCTQSSPCSAKDTSPSRAAGADNSNSNNSNNNNNSTTISSRIPQTCWVRQAVKCHQTCVTDREDWFRFPQWVVSEQIHFKVGNFRSGRDGYKEGYDQIAPESR